MKKTVLFFLIVGMFALTACDRGGGSSVDLNGTWHLQAIMSEDPCSVTGGAVGQGFSVRVVINQSGSDIVLRSEATGFNATGTYTGGVIDLRWVEGDTESSMTLFIESDDVLKGDGMDKHRFGNCYVGWKLTLTRISHQILF